MELETMEKILEKRCEKGTRSRQSGVMLLEVLISILLFALGIMALVGLQTRMLGATGEAQYRAEAVNLVNEYVASMWSHGGTRDEIRNAFDGGAEHNKFIGRARTVLGAHSNPEMTVTFPNTPPPILTGATTTTEVFVRIQWNDSKDPLVRHEYSQNSSLVW
jgi:type IV pilus assembly protein PilV